MITEIKTYNWLNELDYNKIKFKFEETYLYLYAYIDVPLISIGNSCLILKKKNNMWETHIMIDEEFQGLNLGWKAIQKFLKTKRSENLPCYIAHNRIINDNVIKMINKINTNEFNVINNEYGYIIKVKNNI